MSGRINIRTVGRAMTYRFRNDRVEDHVFRLMVDRDGIEECEGYAVRCEQAKGTAWIVVNEDGETVLGLGASTKTGTGLQDCLSAWRRQMWSES